MNSRKRNDKIDIPCPGEIRPGSQARYIDEAERVTQWKLAGSIEEEYDRWRYKYPELDQSGRRAKVPSHALSDELIEELKKEKEPV